MNTRLFIPGPTDVAEPVRLAMARPMIGHRSDAFEDLYERVTTRSRDLFGTEGTVLVGTCSSTGWMEAAVRNLIRRRALFMVNGAFAARWYEIARENGKDAVRCDVPWGRPVRAEAVEAALDREACDAVALVHNETSTGVLSPLAEVAASLRSRPDVLLLVDAVSALGAVSIEMDALGIEHGSFLAPPATYRFDPALAARMAERGTRVVPTLASSFYAECLARDGDTQDGAFPPPSERRFVERLDIVRQLAAAGVRLLAGSDFGTRFTRPGDLVKTMELLVEAGLSPTAALRAATGDAALALGLGTETGTIAPGLAGDLLVVRGDPRSDIRALRQVEAVFRDGRLVWSPASRSGDMATAIR